MLKGKSLEEFTIKKYGISLKVLLHDWYWFKNLTQKQIAAKLGVSSAAICLNFNKYNIPKRKHSYWAKKHSDETKRKISEKNKGKTRSQLTKQNISNAKKGFKLVGKYPRFKGVRNRKDGYIQIHQPEHPLSSKEGYVMEHRLVVERSLGRLLYPDEEIHHINGIKNDNRIENLHLFKNKSTHMHFHMMERHKKEVELRYEYK